MMQGLRLRKAELFRQLRYEPHPVQQAVHRSRAKRRVLACGARFGKSTCAAMECVAAMMEPRERSLGWVVAPTYGLAKKVFGQAVEVVRQHLEHRIVADLPREHRLIVRNLGGGLSELAGKSADHPASLLGEALDYLVVDEAARITESVWQAHLSPRLIDRNGWALVVSTPRGADHWLFRLWRRGQDGHDPDVESWRAPSWENPHLDGAVIDGERERLPKDVFEQEFAAVFLGEGDVPCDTCHGPSATAARIIMRDADEEVQLCPECSQPVDEAGRTAVRLMPDGSRMIQQVVLHDDHVPGLTLEVRPEGMRTIEE